MTDPTAALAEALHSLAAREAVGIVVENEITNHGITAHTRACTPDDHREYAAAILAALPEGWCGHIGVEEVIAQGQARIATLDARIVALNAEVLDRMDQWHRDSLARDELARQQNAEIARLRKIEEEAVAAEKARIRAAVGDMPHNMWTTAQGRERVLRIIEETP